MCKGSIVQRDVDVTAMWISSYCIPGAVLCPAEFLEEGLGKGKDERISILVVTDLSMCVPSF